MSNLLIQDLKALGEFVSIIISIYWDDKMIKRKKPVINDYRLLLCPGQEYFQ
jgi:hypothetical protein